MKAKKVRITVKPAGWKGKTVVKECYLADVGHGRLGFYVLDEVHQVRIWVTILEEVELNEV